MNALHPGSRRHFLQVSSLLGGGLLVSMAYSQPTKSGRDTKTPASDRQFAPSPFVKILPDGAVHLVAKIPELGQGVKTALPMILADAMGADFSTVKIEYGDLKAELGPQEAGGSMSIFDSYQPLRMAGAVARTMLIQAAASTWSVSAKECVAEKSRIWHIPSGRSLGFGELATKAAQLPLPHLSDIAPSGKKEGKLLGKRIGGVDNQAIVTGQALFGIDQTIPGMVHAVYAKSPIPGARALSANIDHIKKLPGIIDAFILEGTADYYGLLPGVAIVGESTWETFVAQDELQVVWDSSAGKEESSESYERQAKLLEKGQGSIVQSTGDSKQALIAAATVVTGEYHYPFLHHAPLEPMNALAIPMANGRMKIIAPTQNPENARDLAAAVLKTPKSKVEFQFTRIGGAFGRRLTNDFVAEAAAIAQRIGRPVKLTWTRESDTQHGQYRPPGWHFLKAGLDKSGNLVAWRNHFITVGLNNIKQPGMAADIDAREFPNRFVPNYRLEKSVVSSNIPTSWYRAPGSNGIAFVTQSFIDELAQQAGKNPLDFSLQLLGADRILPGTGRWDPPFDTARMKAVLRMAAKKADWGRKMPSGSGQGIAFHFCHQGYVAEVAEVTVSKDGALVVNRVVAVVDVGPIINYSGAESQVQGSIIDGLSSTWLQELTIEKGKVNESNFNDFPLLRINAAPSQIDVHFIESNNPPTGLGEPALPPLAPAICNAIYAATGTRIRRLPISKTELRTHQTNAHTMKNLTLLGLDIGSPRLSGKTLQKDNSIELTAAGVDIWGVRDECQFAHIQASGDFEVSVKVESLEMADLYSKAGIMFRSTLDEGSEHVMLLAFGNNDPRNKNNGGLEFQSRITRGGTCSGIYPPQPLPQAPDFPVNFPNVWLKLVRKGDLFTCHSSRDGVQWKQYCQHHQSISKVGLLGLAATSHNEAQAIKSTFSHLQIA